MSIPNQDDCRSDYQVHSDELLDKVIVSNNGCLVPQAESEYQGRDGWARQVVSRFWSKVDKNGPVPIHRPELGQCWLWTGGTNYQGYGQLVFPRDPEYRIQVHVYAHRFAYELTYGRLGSAAVCACHHCDRPLCVRPSHLFAGSRKDNLSDARRKGRLIDGAHLIKLSDDDLATIRREYRPRKNGKALAARYGVTLITIMRVIAGTQRVVKPAPLILERVAHRLLEVRGEVS